MLLQRALGEYGATPAPVCAAVLVAPIAGAFSSVLVASVAVPLLDFAFDSPRGVQAADSFDLVVCGRERATTGPSFPGLASLTSSKAPGCLPLSSLSPLSPLSTAMAEKPAGVDDAETSPATKGASSEKSEAGDAGAVFVYGTLMHEKVRSSRVRYAPGNWRRRQRSSQTTMSPPGAAVERV